MAQTTEERVEARKKRQRRYREVNKAKIAEINRRYRQANTEKIAEYQRYWSQSNPEKCAEYRRRYEESNREQLNERSRLYRESHPENRAETDRRYREANPDSNSIRQRRRRARLAGVDHEPWTTVGILERDGWTCQIDDCRSPDGRAIDPSLEWRSKWEGTADHIIPISLGGHDVLSNLQAAHRACNCAKGARVSD